MVSNSLVILGVCLMVIAGAFIFFEPELIESETNYSYSLGDFEKQPLANGHVYLSEPFELRPAKIIANGKTFEGAEGIKEFREQYRAGKLPGVGFPQGRE